MPAQSIIAKRRGGGGSSGGGGRSSSSSSSVSRPAPAPKAAPAPAPAPKAAPAPGPKAVSAAPPLIIPPAYLPPDSDRSKSSKDKSGKDKSGKDKSGKDKSGKDKSSKDKSGKKFPSPPKLPKGFKPKHDYKHANDPGNHYSDTYTNNPGDRYPDTYNNNPGNRHIDSHQSSHASSGSRSSQAGMICGIIFGLAFLVIIAFVCYWLRKRWLRRRRATLSSRNVSEDTQVELESQNAANVPKKPVLAFLKGSRAEKLTAMLPASVRNKIPKTNAKGDKEPACLLEEGLAVPRTENVSGGGGSSPRAEPVAGTKSSADDGKINHCPPAYVEEDGVGHCKDPENPCKNGKVPHICVQWPSEASRSADPKTDVSKAM